ncbi:MAG: sugar phosphate isomerase/epimerase, partial [Chloroflexota bacterium]|nr:sugar phosphate isomerase/epimerase [Chloroflexota bacterium]
FLGALRRVAGIGYRSVEFAGFGGIPAKELRASLDDYGLHALGAHVAFDQFQDALGPTLNDLKALACEYAVVPSVGERWRRDANAVQELAAELNAIGEACKGEGLQFAYHNHHFEFVDMDDTTMYDLLTQSTDPDLVHLELDLFWAQRGGRDPLELLDRLKGRATLVHVKDMQEDHQSDAPVGEGILPWDQLLPAAEQAGARYYIVEQDHPRDPMEDVRTSFDNLSRLLGVPQAGEDAPMDDVQRRSLKSRH